MSIDAVLNADGLNTDFSDCYVIKQMTASFVKGIPKPYLTLMDKTSSALKRIYEYVFQ